ncbi:MAG: Hpt domain-containing protein, partial [Alphaproteobacteria bacterium]|nr:Hpt domain-containing protein [Alphaproteobacteria bacterium]
AREAGDHETAIREAHTVKGLAGNIGASRMAECAARVESLLKNGEADGLDPSIREMERELSDLRERIAAGLGLGAVEMEMGVPAEAAAVDRAALEKELRRLDALLAESDSDAGAVAEGLAGPLRALGCGKAAEGVLKAVEECDYDAARERLPELARALDVAL